MSVARCPTCRCSARSQRLRNSVVAAIQQKFAGAIADKNVAAATEAFNTAVAAREAINA